MMEQRKPRLHAKRINGGRTDRGYRFLTKHVSNRELRVSGAITAEQTGTRTLLGRMETKVTFTPFGEIGRGPTQELVNEGFFTLRRALGAGKKIIEERLQDPSFVEES